MEGELVELRSARAGQVDFAALWPFTKPDGTDIAEAV